MKTYVVGYVNVPNYTYGVDAVTPVQWWIKPFRANMKFSYTLPKPLTDTPEFQTFIQASGGKWTEFVTLSELRDMLRNLSPHYRVNPLKKTTRPIAAKSQRARHTASGAQTRAPSPRLKARRAVNTKKGYFPNPKTNPKTSSYAHGFDNQFPSHAKWFVLEPRGKSNFSIGDYFESQIKATNRAQELSDASGLTHRVASRAWVQRNL